VLFWGDRVPRIMGWMSHGLAFALVAVLFCLFSCFVSFAQAQSSNATTDPSEGN